MSRFRNKIFIALIALAAACSSPLCELSFVLGGSAGYFLLPQEIHGNINGYPPYSSHFTWAETGTDQYGYTQSYKFKHPFPSSERPNFGYTIGIHYAFQNRIGIFFEGCWTSSINDYDKSNTVHDSIPGDPYTIVPNDYQWRITQSNDRLYLKSFQVGIGLSYTIPLRGKLGLIISGSAGKANYDQYFRIETNSITTNYYQNNGHLVYSETNDVGSFGVFGLRYSALYFKPAVAAEYELVYPLALHAGVACPISLIEKGVYITDSYSNYTTSYYPSARFWAGSPALDVSVKISLGKGGK